MANQNRNGEERHKSHWIIKTSCTFIFNGATTKLTMRYKVWCWEENLKKNLVVECRVTEFLPERVQSLLNDLPALRHGERPQCKQECTFILGQGLQQCSFWCQANYQTDTLWRKTHLFSYTLKPGSRINLPLTHLRNLLWYPIRAELSFAVSDKIHPINEHHQWFLRLLVSQSGAEFWQQISAIKRNSKCWKLWCLHHTC